RPVKAARCRGQPEVADEVAVRGGPDLGIVDEVASERDGRLDHWAAPPGSGSAGSRPTGCRVPTVASRLHRTHAGATRCGERASVHRSLAVTGARPLSGRRSGRERVEIAAGTRPAGTGLRTCETVHQEPARDTGGRDPRTRSRSAGGGSGDTGGQ